MKTSLFNLRHHGRIGPGGWRCTCCGIPPKSRRKAAKAMKRRMYHLLDTLEKDPKEM